MELDHNNIKLLPVSCTKLCLTIYSLSRHLIQVIYYYRHFELNLFVIGLVGGHGGRVVTLSPPTSEARVGFPTRPQVGKLVVDCHWSAVYSTEP